MAVGPVANWKSAKVKALIKQLRPPAGVAVIIGIGVPFLMGRWSVAVAMGVAVAAWIATTVVTGILQRMRATRRSEEHTSELQSLMRISYAVFCLKKKIYQKST